MPLRKKEFTSFDVAIAVHELKEVVANSRVNNIYQLNKKTLILKLHKTDKPPLRLVMEAGRRLHLTAYALKPPRIPPAFCMALRKHLRGAWIGNIEQYEFERIVTINFKTKTGMLRLFLELFGEGNIILTGGKGEILQALIFKRMRDRNIVRNEVFQFPPSIGKNPFKMARGELAEALRDSGNIEVVRSLARFLGVGGFYAEEILLRANVEKTTSSNALDHAEFDAIFDALQDLLLAVSGFTTYPHIILAEDDSFVDVAPFKLKRYEAFRCKRFTSFNEALDEFFLRATAVEKALASIEVNKLTREAERLRRIMAEQQQALCEDESKAERDRQIGDVIYEHSSEIQALLNRFATAKREGKDWKILLSEIMTAKKDSFVESFDSRNFIINLCVDNLYFSLNPRRTLFENAAEYYERGKKAKQKSAGALTALAESRKKLAEIEQKIREVEQQKNFKPMEVMEELVKRKVKRKEWYEKFRWFTSSDGFLVVAGKDAVSNEVLVKKYAGANDAIFHADVSGAPFVVVKTEGKTATEKALREAGEFAAAFSRAWREGAGSADVYWVKPSQLTKHGPSGEYVPHGAFAVNGKRNWMRNMRLKLAIGIVVGETLEFVGGAVDAIKAKTNVYVTLVPGDVAGKELLKQILKVLTLRLPKEQREKVGKTSIERVREFVPYTKGRLAENVT
ncbi:MAG: ribosome rescue protein RqcH [Candidatus Bathyarchaeota archaeon]|nr:ribosome rescue protein RqcH [Candidatus Bathyarchaeota archaeon]